MEQAAEIPKVLRDLGCRSIKSAYKVLGICHIILALCIVAMYVMTIIYTPYPESPPKPVGGRHLKLQDPNFYIYMVWVTCFLVHLNEIFHSLKFLCKIDKITEEPEASPYCSVVLYVFYVSWLLGFGVITYDSPLGLSLLIGGVLFAIIGRTLDRTMNLLSEKLIELNKQNIYGNYL